MSLPPDILEACLGAGARPAHLRRITTGWLRGQALDGLEEARHRAFPRALQELLPELEQRLQRVAHVASEHPSDDGSCRLLIALERGSSVESVLLARGALCVSTQVGCAVGCRFCKTGENGLVRQLAAHEILAQVAVARRRQAVRRVVLMGMGEPAHNLEAVLVVLNRLGHEGGIGHKELVFSTVGDERCFERLAANEVKPALALSLHSTSESKRAELLPRAPRIAPADLVEAADRYSLAVTHPLQVQWTLLEGVNDGDDELEGLAQLMQGRRAIVNFIPFNPGDDLPYRRPAIERCVEMVRALKRRGVRATLRRSGGQDVDGACGQLRARMQPAG